MAAFKASIVDSQQHGQKFRDLCERVYRLECRDTSLIFEASESLISVANRNVSLSMSSLGHIVIPLSGELPARAA